MPQWFDTPPGRYVLDWEARQFDTAVSNLFGYHALQLGLPAIDALQANRISHQWLAAPASSAPETGALGGRTVSLVTEFSALPFPAASLDLVVLPHTLDSHPNPHATLREVARVLVPEGRVVISGFNPLSLWGLRHGFDQLCDRLGARHGWGEPYLPGVLQLIGNRRLRDWLHLLDFEIEVGHFGAYRPAVRTDAWLQRLSGLESLGQRAWPILGAVYCLVAVKRVHGMRLLGPAWKTATGRAASTVPVAQRSGDNHALTIHRDPL